MIIARIRSPRSDLRHKYRDYGFRLDDIILRRYTRMLLRVDDGGLRMRKAGARAHHRWAIRGTDGGRGAGRVRAADRVQAAEVTQRGIVTSQLGPVSDHQPAFLAS